ncbi:YncE family protein [Polyangium fumosum]|uniref:Uncharacterized protein n=1 Tax=Polyangium fumosum TaxID=889272 RepID=A0A4U1I949_9BACT|nr:hypothetical protein [Polyangium fumosum]TKC90021.1 hypothetical protein E8A74_51215 [Polyangium fumosum]
MKIRFGLPLFLAATAIVVSPRPVAAWDSICYRYKDANAKVGQLEFTPDSRGCEGIEAARGRWRDPEFQLDEHRYLFERAAKAAGLPPAVLETMSLTVLTGPASNTVVGEHGELPTIDVKAPAAAHRAVLRSFALDELAQLPDFSFSMWDWARGNETCPLKSLPSPFDAAQACHVFATHMGATNSNHFPPQSDLWFEHYHQLALGRAAECSSTRAAIWNAEPMERRTATDARFATFFRACEVEALAYEAVAQHYLQDSWSAGHMWQRWGSANLKHFPETKSKKDEPEDLEWNDLEPQLLQLLTAEIVALSAGTIHGTDPVLFEVSLEKPYLPTFTFRDPMCFPHEDVSAMDNDVKYQVVGDMHLHDAVGGLPNHDKVSNKPLPYATAVLDGQAQKLLDCVKGSLGAVYAQLSDGMSFGAPVLGAAMWAPPSFDASACRAPKATNLSISRGIEDREDWQLDIAEDEGVLAKIPVSIEGKARSHYGRLRNAAKVLAKLYPEGTELSALQLASWYEGGFCDSTGCKTIAYTPKQTLFTMLGVQPNRCYSTDPADKDGCTTENGNPMAPPEDLAPFVDPALPTHLPPPDPNDPGGALALAFHASRAPQLCDAVTAADLAALPKLIDIAPGGDALRAACDACAEWVAPFLRVGNDITDYDKTAEPLCYFASVAPDNVPYIYEPSVSGATDPIALARRHCGCVGLVAGTNAGIQRLQVTTLAGVAEINQVGDTVPVGSLPRDIAPASGRRLLVTTSAGQIVGVRDDAEVDLDGDAGNGITRLSFPGISSLDGIAVINAAAKELVLAVSPVTGELVAYDLGANMLCERFSVAQVAGQGAYDVVVSADGSKVWISLRGLPLSGALASVSLPALAQCNGTAQATLQWLATPGAVAGLQPMALSPDGSSLAVGGRLASTCPDQIHTASYQAQNTQVGCDRVFVLDVATNTWKSFGSNASMPTRPGRYPYGIAWFQDSSRLAFATFQGIDNLGSGDSGWPANSGAVPRIPIGGTLRIADTFTPSYEGGGVGGPRYWSYNMPLQGNVAGPTVVVEGGAFDGAGWVFVGTMSGRVSAYPVAQHDASLDPMWEASEADPETALHTATNGSWYGGCHHSCNLPGGVCPDVCPNNTIPGGFGSIELGSSVRVLAAY